MAKKKISADEEESPRAASFMREVAESRDDGDEEEPTKSVDLDAEEEEEEEESPGQTPRQAKRSNRFAKIQEENAALRREADESKRRAELLEVSRQSTEMYARGVQQLISQAPPGKSAEDTELERISGEQASLRDGFLGRRSALPQGQDLPRTDYDDYNKKQQDLADKRSTLIARKTIGSSQPQGMSRQDVSVEANRIMLLQRFPDVMGVQQYATFAAHQYQAKLSAGISSEQALVESIDAARVQFKLKRESAEQRQRAKSRLAGPPSGNIATPSGKRIMELTQSQRKMAETRYPKLAAQDPSKAWRKWANTVGPGLAEDEAGR